MEKEKIIYVSVASVLTLIFVVSLVFFAFNQNVYWLLVCCLAILFVGRPLNYWYDRQKENKNPLSFARVKNALSYVVARSEGTKEEFIENKGEEIYNHFLNIGYIHEPHLKIKKNSIKWEVTQLGINRKEKMCH